MIDRASIKERGKEAFKSNYWMCVVGALVTFIAARGGVGGGSGSGSSSSNDDLSNSLRSISQADPDQQ